ncbi:GTP cyclohydrolase I [Bradyrhizobium zhanjiangense]|uniref:GTP cyclohydrolase I n=2 Tax=Bradyrhizobium zhanjiangense TaxID=1325107 RepID=A0A4Q0QE40_9BRAD|nr:GTP cyclohydrolase I [Bradyrhizobium zhanjiangense]
MSSTHAIRERLRDAGASFAANDNIAEYLLPGDIDVIQAEVEQHVQAVLEALVIDTSRDHNTKATAKRVARMYVREVFAGRFEPAPEVTDFPSLNELYTLGPIAVRSTCSHHLVPMTGRMWVGVVPGEKVIGISKFVRLANWIMSRPHIQDLPKGLAVIVRAQHQCMIWRGVRETDTIMITSIMRGAFRDDRTLRSEFMALIKDQP